MGISIDGVRHHFMNNQVSPGITENKDVSRENKDRHFDKILITSNSRQVEEKKMAEDLKSCVMSKVDRTAPAEKIEQLRKSVSEGTYEINVNELAGRIMLERGDLPDE